MGAVTLKHQARGVCPLPSPPPAGLTHCLRPQPLNPPSAPFCMHRTDPPIPPPALRPAPQYGNANVQTKKLFQRLKIRRWVTLKHVLYICVCMCIYVCVYCRPPSLIPTYPPLLPQHPLLPVVA